MWPSDSDIGKYLMLAWIGLTVAYVLRTWLGPERHIKRAVRLAMRDRYDEAIAYLRGVIERKGPSIARLNALGLLLLDHLRFAEALEQFDRCAQLFGPDINSGNNRAIALQRLGRSDEAIRAIEEVVARYPEEVVCLCNYASLLDDAGRRIEAYAALARAEEIYARHDPKYLPDTWKYAIEECRKQLPKSVGFEVVPRQAGT